MKTLLQLKQQYLEYCELQKELNTKTLKAYQIVLKQFLDFIPSTTLPVTKEELSD